MVSDPNRTEWNGFGALAAQPQTKQTNSINCTIAFKFYITKTLLNGTQTQEHSAPKSCTRKASYLKCTV
jgi:hypothetical protein